MLIVLYKWHFYIYFIELVSFNTELYPKASACFYVQMFLLESQHSLDTRRIHKGKTSGKVSERDNPRVCSSQKVDGLSVCIY